MRTNEKLKNFEIQKENLKYIRGGDPVDNGGGTGGNEGDGSGVPVCGCGGMGAWAFIEEGEYTMTLQCLSCFRIFEFPKGPR